MSTVISFAIAAIVVIWVLWNVLYIAAHGAEDVRFFKAARGWDE